VALIKSISGIRGTIGGKPGENLTPLDVVKFTAAFGTIIATGKQSAKIVIGRDGRISSANGTKPGGEYTDRPWY
jgi:phosphomannomutase